MKISQIGLNTPLITPKFLYPGKLQTNPIYKQKNPDKIFECYYGRDLVSFGNAISMARYDEKKFGLPEGCLPDGFQCEAAGYTDAGKNVIVEAPTGTGKTAVANYAVSKNMAEGKKTFYTTPLKALSNQKFKEFCDLFGEENVGILTGDRQENPDAPIVIMTTEIYRNMVLAKNYGESTYYDDNPGTVIFDEFHYLGDASRGPVWEEAVMFTPQNVQILALSATIGNSDEISNWINNVSGNDTKLISVPKRARHVPLEYETYCTDSYLKDEAIKSKEGTADDIYEEKYAGIKNSRPSVRDFRNLISELKDKDRLPAIFFIFSKRFSRSLTEYIASSGEDLTNMREKEEIERIYMQHKKNGYVGSDLDMLALKKGYALHNAGIIPAQKALIEELFQKKLLKAVFATETLAAGINMPAKTVVITSPYKPTDMIDGERFRAINPNEFMQMAGRAGRRGMDKKGYVYSMPTDVAGKRLFKRLQMSDSIPVESKYQPDYSFITEYYKHYDNPDILDESWKKCFYTMKNGNSTEELSALTSAKTDVLIKTGFMRKNNDGTIALTDKGYMLSGITSEHDLLTADVFAELKEKNISPEVLSMLAGSVVCAGNGASSLSFVKEAIRNADFEIHEVYSEMYRSIRKTLEKFGKQINDFGSFTELKEYVKRIEPSGQDEYELKNRLSEKRSLLEKAKKINEYDGIYYGDDILNAVKKKQILPTSVLIDAYNEAEAYIETVGYDDVEAYREHLKQELENIKSGSGSKHTYNKKCSELKSEIKKLKKYIKYRKMIPDLIQANNEFLKQNNVEQMKRECTEIQDQLALLTSGKELLAEIEGMEALERDFSSEEFDEISKINEHAAFEGIYSIIKKADGISESERECGIKSSEFTAAIEYGKAIYEWTILNKYNPNTKANWIQIIKLLNTNSIDEGSLYRGIMQTIDLVKQIENIARTQAENAFAKNNTEEYGKYLRLANTAREAANLMKNPPITM